MAIYCASKGTGYRTRTGWREGGEPFDMCEHSTVSEYKCHIMGKEKKDERPGGWISRNIFYYPSFASIVLYSVMAQTVQGIESGHWSKRCTAEVSPYSSIIEKGGRSGELRYHGQAETGERCRGSLRESVYEYCSVLALSHLKSLIPVRLPGHQHTFLPLLSFACWEEEWSQERVPFP